MTDLTVENMFVQKSFEVKHLVPGEALGALDRKRMLTHVIADITDKILSTPGSNPVGLCISVTLAGPVVSGLTPNLLVTASCPQYELDEDFFTH